MSEPDFFIHQFEVGPWDNFVYLVGCRKTRRAAVVDPAWESATILREAARLDVKITDIICTHSHFDHVNRVDEVLSQTDAAVHMLAAEVDFSGFRSENLNRHAPADRIRVGDIEIECLHTPGHTPGSLTLKIGDNLITGDTLFVNGCGRCDFVGGDPVVMYSTLRGLCDKLPGATVMYPGHNYGSTPTSTLDEQLRTNPYLVLPTLNDFVAHRMTGKTPNTKPMAKPEWPTTG